MTTLQEVKERSEERAGVLTLWQELIPTWCPSATQCDLWLERHSFATVIYALRFESGGLANAFAWAAVFSLGVCLAIAIWWIVPLRESPPTEDFQNIPVPVSLEQTFRAVQIASAVSSGLRQ